MEQATTVTRIDTHRAYVVVDREASSACAQEGAGVAQAAHGELPACKPSRVYRDDPLTRGEVFGMRLLQAIGIVFAAWAFVCTAVVRRLLVWWAKRRIASTYAELNLRLAAPFVGPDFVANQLQNIDHLERRVVALSR